MNNQVISKKGFLVGALLGLGAVVLMGYAVAGVPDPNGEPDPQILVGELLGHVAVDNTGAASYAIPIDVSPGTAGMEPKLAISYSSQRGNGLLGVGFSVDGLSGIVRSSATRHHDGFIDGVDFDGNDRFMLDGQRLVLVSSGSYGDDGSKYRTEIDSFSRITLHGGMNDSTSYFTVETKSGLVMEYGHATGAMKPDGRTENMSWLVDRVADTVGNYMQYVYTNHVGTVGELLLDHIEYTLNDGQSLAAFNTVEFVYENRPDTLHGFKAGSEFNRTQRLERIRVMHGTDEVCNYQLGYIQNNSNVSLLKSVQKFMGADSIPKTLFDWNSEGAAEGWSANHPEFAPVLPLAKTVIQKLDGPDELFVGRAVNLVSDLNGNGLTDVLYSEYWGSVYAEITSTNTGMGFSSFETNPHFYLFNYLYYNDISFYDESDLYDPGYRIVDLNGDGLPDVMTSWELYNLNLPHNTFKRQKTWLNNGSGGWNESTAYKPSLRFSYHFNSNVTRTILDSGIRFEDLNGDGLSDMLASYYIGGTWAVGAYTNNGNGFSADSAYRPPFPFIDISSRNNLGTRFLDLNGDGLVDIVNANANAKAYWSGVRLNAGNGWESTNSVAYALPYNLVDGDGHDIGTRFVDVNGDGLVDVLNDTNSVYLNTGTGWLEDTNGVYTLPENTILVDNTIPVNKRDLTRFIDLNGDGLSDLIFMNGVNDPVTGYTQRTHLNNGHGWDFQTNAVPYALPHPFARSHDGHTAPLGQFFQDLDGDGLVDYFYNHRWMKRSAGGTYYDQGETEGAVLNQGTFGNLLTKVTKGWRSETVHGLATELDYRPITDTDIYIKGSNQSFPYRDVQAALYVVTEQRRDYGMGDIARTLYTYSEAISHRDRGFLGFKIFDSYDVQKQMSQIDTLKQKFPHTGSVELSQTYYIPNTNDFSTRQLIKQVENTYLYDNVAGGTVFPYVGKSVEAQWDYTTAETRELISTNTTYNWFDGQSVVVYPPAEQPDPATLPGEITHGNLTQVLMNYGDGSWELSQNSYTSTVTTTQWHIGRLSSAVVKHDHPNKTLIEKASSFGYDPTTGLLKQEVSEPGHATLELTTDYQYDGFGNITNKTVSGANIATRNVQQSIYDPQGRFVVETRNALGHKETIEEYDPQLGLVLRKKGPNGIPTSWQHDAMGRTLLETRADTTTTSTSYDWTASNAYVTLTFDDPGGAGTLQIDSPYKITTTSSGAPTSTTWFDRKGRGIRSQTTGPDGRTILQDTVYNTLGQTTAVSEPYFSGAAVLYTRTTYDPLERPRTVTLPDGTINEYTYDGLEATAIIDSTLRTGTPTAKHQISKTEKNLRGQIVKVTDALGKALVYEYHADGNLHKTIAPGNIVTEMLYDLRGNKTWQSDPDMGTWIYLYNALGELVSQTDAKSQTTTMLYDPLGRMYQRTASDGVAKWFFDNEGEAGKLGALHREELFDGTGTNRVYRKTYAYDSLGRPHFDLMNYDNKWYYNYVKYDTFSRVEETHRFWRPQSVIASGDNLSPDWNTFGTINTFDAIGTVMEVRDTKDHLWWSRNAADYTARGNLKQFTLGNSIITTVQVHDPLTGRIQSARSHHGTNPSNVAFYNTYGFDRIGNLDSRQNASLMLTETFTYDEVNRLRETRLGGTLESTVAYDNSTLGNRIASKTGVGNYTYGNSAHRHAVTAAAGISYLYDSNGNLEYRTVGGSNTTHVTWTSFNKPLRIDTDAANPAGSSTYSEFTYGIDHTRITQIVRDGNSLRKKIYIGGMEQEETSSNLTNPIWSNTETRIFIATPSGVIGVHVQDAAEQITRKYFHKDHLGSIIAVTDSSGQTLAQYSYDGWGNRRNVQTWSSGSIDPFETDRGFTGHEMLDNVELVHMNGRIYDPVIGLFLSADSILQAPYNLQNYNRYSYVINNPLTFNDPSGHIIGLLFAWLGAAYGIVAGAIVSAGIFLAANPVLVGMILGGISGGMNGGVGGAIMGAFMGGVVTGLFAGPQVSIMGSSLLSSAVKILAHGVVQGGLAELSGGDFGPAFLAGFAGAALGKLSGSIPFIKYNSAAGLIAAAVIGGTASELGGGKFANGAITGSFAYLLSTGFKLKKLSRDALSLGTTLATDLNAFIIGQGYGSIITLRDDLKDIGSTLYHREFGKAGISILKTAWNTVVPKYDWMGGSGWGRRQYYDDKTKTWSKDPQTHPGEVASRHDLTGDHLQWVIDSWTPSQSNLPTGPIGLAYQLLGTGPFAVAGGVQRGYWAIAGK